jgi:hypothetical protein
MAGAIPLINYIGKLPALPEVTLVQISFRFLRAGGPAENSQG